MEGPGTSSRVGHRRCAQRWQLLCVCACPPSGPCGYLAITPSLGSLQQMGPAGIGLGELSPGWETKLCVSKDIISRSGWGTSGLGSHLSAEGSFPIEWMQGSPVVLPFLLGSLAGFPSTENGGYLGKLVKIYRNLSTGSASVFS